MVVSAVLVHAQMSARYRSLRLQYLGDSYDNMNLSVFS